MAGPEKRRAVKKDDSESSDNNESDDESYNSQEVIQADFEGRNPEGQDFHGIKQLLQQLFLKAHIDLSQLTDMIIAQNGIGSVLKQSTYDDEAEDDDDMSDPLDVFGVTSILNISSHYDTPCIDQIVTLVRELSEQYCNVQTQKEIANILMKSNKLGLLINERFVNIPAKISDPLLTSLIAEVERMQKKDQSYAFDYFIMISKLHKPKGDNSDIVYANGEEEIFGKEAKVSFEFNVVNESDTSVAGKWSEGDVEMIPYRKIMFIDAKKFGNIIQQIKVFVN